MICRRMKAIDHPDGILGNDDGWKMIHHLQKFIYHRRKPIYHAVREPMIHVETVPNSSQERSEKTQITHQSRPVEREMQAEITRDIAT
eukprot:3098532-Amphidinium_carterae.1